MTSGDSSKTPSLAAVSCTIPIATGGSCLFPVQTSSGECTLQGTQQHWASTRRAITSCVQRERRRAWGFDARTLKSRAGVSLGGWKRLWRPVECLSGRCAELREGHLETSSGSRDVRNGQLSCSHVAVVVMVRRHFFPDSPLPTLSLRPRYLLGNVKSLRRATDETTARGFRAVSKPEHFKLNKRDGMCPQNGENIPSGNLQGLFDPIMAPPENSGFERRSLC